MGAGAEPLLVAQALARGWAARRQVRKRAERAARLGTPLVHPMTRLMHPVTGYYSRPQEAKVELHGHAHPRARPVRAASPARQLLNACLIGSADLTGTMQCCRNR